MCATHYNVLNNFDTAFITKWDVFSSQISNTSNQYSDSLAPDMRIVFKFVYTHMESGVVKFIISTTIGYNFNVIL